MAQARTRRRFTAEYKGEAVKRLEESGRSLQQVADELGIHANQLRGWRDEQRAAGSAEALAKQKGTRSESPGGGCSAVTRGTSFGAAGVIRWTHVVAPSRSGRPVT